MNLSNSGINIEWLCILDKWERKANLKEAPAQYNEIERREGAFEAEGKTYHVLLQRFDTFLSITVAFGKVRVDEHGMHYGKCGLAAASCHYRAPEHAGLGEKSGCGIPGYHLEGISYRVGMYAPKSRMHLGLDVEIESGDIISWLASCERAIHYKTQDLTRREVAIPENWKGLKKGW